MSRSGQLLPIPAGSEIAVGMDALVALWPDGFTGLQWPRSAWLGIAERVLGGAYPQSSSADRNITARSLAPFPLAQPATRLNR